VRCLEPGTIRKITVIPFDGEDWEDHVLELVQPSSKS
jgi:hypothetical protein